MRTKWMFVLVCVSLLLALAVTPVLAAGAVDGDGMMSVSPTHAVYSSSGNTFVFTFTADNDFPSGSQVQLTIPAGWTAPINTVGAGRISVSSGTCALIGSPLFAITGRTIFVDIDRCNTGEFFTITYSGVTVPSIAGSPYSFTTATDISGGNGLFEIFSGSPQISVDPKPITVTGGLTPAGKTYDGNTSVSSITVGSPTLAGVVPGDAVSLDTSAPVGTYADRNAGVGKSVTITGLTLSGTDAANYTLVDPTRTATISPLPITVTAATDSKAYDGTDASSGVPTLSVGTPLVAGDNEPIWTQTFDNKNAGTGKSLTPAGLVDDGNTGQNYSYNFVPDTTGEITTLRITVTAVTDTKEYDGTTSSTGLPVLSVGTPLAFGDSEPIWTQTFDTKNVGINKILTPAGLVVDGNNGNNYSYTYDTVATGEITQSPITVTADAKSKAIGDLDPTLTYQVTSGNLATGDDITLMRAPGETPGVYPITVASFPAQANYNLTFVGADFTITPIFVAASQSARDGWILEVNQNTGRGGTRNSSSSSFILGDDASNRQYRSILSFDTSALPDNAIIQSVTVRIKVIGTPVGTNPFNVLGKLWVDVRTGSFGAPALAVTDFQRPASASQAGFFKKKTGGWYNAIIGPIGLDKINTLGMTQFRVYFNLPTNADAKANTMSFFSGDSLTGQPQLIIKYTLP